MTLLGSRKDRSRLRPADVKELGTAGGARFVTFDKHEYMLDLQPLDAGAVPRPAGEGEIRVTRDASRTDYGTVTHYAETFRGVRVKDGTYASLAAKDQARADRKAARGQPALARYASNTPGLSGRAGHVMSGGAMRSLPALPAGSGAVGETEVIRAGISAALPLLKNGSDCIASTTAGPGSARVLVLTPRRLRSGSDTRRRAHRRRTRCRQPRVAAHRRDSDPRSRRAGRGGCRGTGAHGP
jgi:hypothetical protein